IELLDCYTHAPVFHVIRGEGGGEGFAALVEQEAAASCKTCAAGPSPNPLPGVPGRGSKAATPRPVVPLQSRPTKDWSPRMPRIAAALILAGCVICPNLR